MRKLLSLITLSVLLLVLYACGGGEEASNEGASDDVEQNEETITIKVGHIAGPDEPYSIGFNQYAEAVEEATDGRVQFEIFANGELGGEADVTEQVQMGSVDMSLVTTGVLGDFYDDLSVLDLPFLFRDVDHAYTVLDSDFGQELLDGMSELGIKSIAFWENGVLYFASEK